MISLEPNSTVVVCGPTGTGKKTLCDELARSHESDDVWCLSADPGSPAFGPPAAATLAHWVLAKWVPTTSVGLATLDAIRFRVPLAEAARTLVENVPDDAISIVLAPGVSRGTGAAELIAALTSATAADHLLILGNTEVDRLVPPSVARTRIAPQSGETPGKGARRRRRSQMWNHFLADARRSKFDDVVDLQPDVARPGRLVVAWSSDSPIGLGLVETNDDDLVTARWVRTDSTEAAPVRVVLRDAHVDDAGQLRTTSNSPEEDPDPVVKRRNENGPFTSRPRPRIPIPLPTDRIVSGRLVAVGDWFDDPMFVLRLDHRRRCLAFDLGEVRRLPTRVVHELTDVFVSHAHLDHVRDFLWLIRKRLGCEDPCRLYGPTGFARRVRHMLEACRWDRVEDRGPRFDVAEYDGSHLSWFSLQVGDDRPLRQGDTIPAPDGVILHDDRFVVRSAVLDHGIPVLAYSVEENARYDVRPDRLDERGWTPGAWLGTLKSRAAAGELQSTIEVPGEGELSVGQLADLLLVERPVEKLVYATDLADHPANRRALVDLARGAELLICEIGFRQSDRAQAERTGHLTTRACGEIAAEAGVGHLVPFHPSTRYQEEWRELLDEVREAFPRVVTGFSEQPE